MVWFLVGYMWLFLHRPFEFWTILGTLRIERVYMIFILIVWFTVSKKEWTENRVNFGLCALAFAIFFSTLMSPYLGLLDNETTQNWFKMFLFYLLFMTSVKTEKDLKILTTAFTVCFFIYMLHSYREYLNGRGAFEMGTWRMIGVDVTMGHPNTFGNSIVYAATMLLPLTALLKKRWQWLFAIGYCLLSLRCIQLTGSRGSMMGLCVFLVGTAVISKHRLKIIPLLFVAAPLLWFSLPENLQQRYLTLFGLAERQLGDAGIEGRMNGFWMGLVNFQSSPIWGIGLECHRYGAGQGFSAHQLYGQLLGETGLIGVIAFLMLLSAVFINHWEAMQAYQTLNRIGKGKDAVYCYRVSSATIAGYMMLLFFGLAAHNLPRYTWVWYAGFQGIALAILKDKVTKVRHARMNGDDPGKLDLS